jgi:electron transport complex protein RnfG
MKKILKLTVILFIVCAIVAGVLGVINELTKDRIAEQNRLKTEKAYAAVLKADSYEAVEFDSAAWPTVDSISKAGDAGHVVETTFSGAQGSITMAVGVDADLKVTGISIIKHAETAGLGAVAASTNDKGVAFRAQFVGEDKNVAITKAGGNIEAISGATITSRAVSQAAGNAVCAVEALS